MTCDNAYQLQNREVKEKVKVNINIKECLW